ncbi:MAG: thiolase family protein [Mycobacteriales bacterium]
MGPVRVAGAAMTAFGKIPGRTLRSLAEEAVQGALADAALGPDDVQMVFFGNAAEGLLSGQEMIRGQSALRHTGLLGRPVVNVENACASATTAFRLACMAVESGAADVALAVGAEKLTHADKARPLAAIGTAIDLSEPPTLAGRIAGDEDPAGPRSYFMDVYAAMAADYTRQSGATEADYADVAVKNGRHGALNPKAQYRNGVTRDEVLASRLISPPLRLLMCSPVSDGAAALVVCSESFARRHGGADVRVRACELRSGTDRGADDLPGVTLAANAAYEASGLGPNDVHVAEVHDGAAPAELIVYEQLGLCAPGEGPKLLASGDTALGGRVPVNTGGGLLSRGHPIGATGCAQLVELVDQLRGRAGARQVPDARLALAENAGGYLDTDSAAIGVTLLSR